MLTAIAGINWGDEGKGRMIDFLGEQYDVIVRYQGGNNAGHTVINNRGKFVLNLLPSGILRENTVNVMGTGMVVDIEHLVNEIASLTEKGVSVSPKNLKISDKAVVCFPYHRKQDVLEEDRLADKKFGSTRRGIAPVYSDKFMKKAIRMIDLVDLAGLEKRLTEIIEWKNLTLSGYGANQSTAEMMDWLKKFAPKVTPYICDTGEFLSQALSQGKNVMLEAQLGALRDIDFGIYPYTTSSCTLASYGPIGAGIPGTKLSNTIGIIKAYSSCVGEGPFVAELFGEQAQALRTAGDEFGAATGRPRRVGGFDIPASVYGIKLQSADCLALTKLDILSYLEKIPVCVAYEIDGKITTTFPDINSLNRAKPVYEYLDGFMEDVSKCRKVSDLPKNALSYVKYIQKVTNCPIKYISVGAERDDLIIVGENEL